MNLYKISRMRRCAKISSSFLPLLLQGQGRRNYVEHLSRKPVKVHDPSAAKTIQDKRVSVPSVEKAKLDNTRSTNLFNLIMGEIMMGKSHKRIAVEGGRLVEDGIKAGLKMEHLFLLRSIKEVPEGIRKCMGENTEQEVHRVGLKAMELWSEVKTAPGIIGIFKKPGFEDQQLNIQSERLLPLTIICDNVREPGNLGSTLRSAAGAGCTDVMLMKGCVDPWNMKALRGGAGAQFRIPVCTDVTDTLLVRLIETKILKLSKESENNATTTSGQPQFSFLLCDSNVTDPRVDIPCTSFKDVDYSKYLHNFLVLGGETEGISTEVLNLGKVLDKKGIASFHRIRIPLANGIESLNVASAFGIITFEILRQYGISLPIETRK